MNVKRLPPKELTLRDVTYQHLVHAEQLTAWAESYLEQARQALDEARQAWAPYDTGVPDVSILRARKP